MTCMRLTLLLLLILLIDVCFARMFGIIGAAIRRGGSSTKRTTLSRSNAAINASFNGITATTVVMASFPPSDLAIIANRFSPFPYVPDGIVLNTVSKSDLSAGYITTTTNWSITLPQKPHMVSQIPQFISEVTGGIVPVGFALALFREKDHARCVMVTKEDIPRGVYKSYITFPLPEKEEVTFFTEPNGKGCSIPYGPLKNGSYPFLSVAGINSVRVHERNIALIMTDGEGAMHHFSYGNHQVDGHEKYSVRVIGGTIASAHVCAYDMKTCSSIVETFSPKRVYFTWYSVPKGYLLHARSSSGILMMEGTITIPFGARHLLHDPKGNAQVLKRDVTTTSPTICASDWCFGLEGELEMRVWITTISVPPNMAVLVKYGVSWFSPTIYTEGTHIISTMLYAVHINAIIMT